MTPEQISEEHRAAQLRLNRQTNDRLADVLPALNLRDIDGSAPGWLVAVGSVTAGLHDASTSLGQEAYLAYRREAGARGSVQFLTSLLDERELQASLLRMGPYWAKKAMARGARIPDVARMLLGQTSGVSLRYGQAGGRDLISRTAARDTRSVGWMRIARGDACGFCKLVADKGAIYKESTATFAAHDHCQCTAVPMFDGQVVGPEASAIQYIASKRQRTTAEKAALREWVRVYENR